MNEVKVPLVINKLQSKAIFDELLKKNKIKQNELYLIQNDEASEVTSVSFDTENRKFIYKNNNNESIDIITIPVLKGYLNLNDVATSGSYNSLSSQPQINGVTLSGNKTTSDLKISYNDLTNQPSIPELTNTYSYTDESKAMTGKATAAALNGYVSKTTSVTGVGALSGGGTLENNLMISHKTSPVGLTPSAVKIASDSYGHVQIGSAITASDVNAQSTNYKTLVSCSNIDAFGYNTILIVGTTSETISFQSVPTFGNKLRLYYVNITDQTINVTIDPANFQSSTYFFFNGAILTQPYVYNVAANSNLCMDITLIQHTIDGTPTVFTFADVIENTRR
jgi:hypothetical protein